ATELLTTRKLESKKMVNDYIQRDIDGLLDLAIPGDGGAQRAASMLATSISALIENLCTEDGSKHPESSAANSARGAGKGRGSASKKTGRRSSSNPCRKSAAIISKWILEQQQLEPAKNKPVETTCTGDAAALSKSVDGFGRWISNDNKSTHESKLYGPIAQFFCFVASCIKLSHKSQRICPNRLVVPFSAPDRKCADGDDNSRADLILNMALVDDYKVGTLIATPKTDKNKSPRFIDAFALVEVKSSADGVDSAMPQLFRYTRGIYEEQYDRRFVWGLAVSGKHVKVVFFGPNYALASPTIDVGQKHGRLQLVTLLANWSFCESHQLGYDPSIIYHKARDYYEIMVDHKGKTKTYYSVGAVISAERLFGRHTRCFLASEKAPAPNAEPRPDVFIKDAWPEATEDEAVDYRDESRHLQKITEMLDKVKRFEGADGRDAWSKLEGKCPRYDSGGRVQFKRVVPGGSTETIEDTSRSIISRYICDQLDRRMVDKKVALLRKENEKLAEDDIARLREQPSLRPEHRFPLRVHKRICMKGIGRPIKYIGSVFELICVMADVMECHWEIYNRCKILHRDISTNNILFTGSGSSIKGMLIDFDHAICEDDKDAVRNFERTGTLPFMSINNLEGGLTEHSLLDDWESLIYILCWVGTYDWRKKEESGQAPNIPERRIVVNTDRSKNRTHHQTTGASQRTGNEQAAEPTKKKISKWCQSDLFECADTKRSVLDKCDSFEDITEGFDKNIPYIGGLITVVSALRTELIDDPKKIMPRGARWINPEPTKQAMKVDLTAGLQKKADKIDPFKLRAPYASVIAEKLLG
ncbi:hypothetical protein GGI23_005608, partial [Coemansia sp. RSA 2559]